MYTNISLEGANTNEHHNFVFVGNLPTRATNEQIWEAVNGNTLCYEIYIPNKRDKNNNRFAFLHIKRGFTAEEAVKMLHNTLLFGRKLGFAVAKKKPLANIRGYKPPTTPNLTETERTNKCDINKPRVGAHTEERKQHSTNFVEDGDTGPGDHLASPGVIKLPPKPRLLQELRYSLIGWTKEAAGRRGQHHRETPCCRHKLHKS